VKKYKRRKLPAQYRTLANGTFEKLCAKCGEWKSLTDYHLRSNLSIKGTTKVACSSWHHTQAWCKPCMLEHNRVIASEKRRTKRKLAQNPAPSAAQPATSSTSQ